LRCISSTKKHVEFYQTERTISHDDSVVVTQESCCSVANGPCAESLLRLAGSTMAENFSTPPAVRLCRIGMVQNDMQTLWVLYVISLGGRMELKSLWVHVPTMHQYTSNIWRSVYRFVPYLVPKTPAPNRQCTQPEAHLLVLIVVRVSAVGSTPRCAPRSERRCRGALAAATEACFACANLPTQLPGNDHFPVAQGLDPAAAGFDTATDLDRWP
jgi:hypothetical protein